MSITWIIALRKHHLLSLNFDFQYFQLPLQAQTYQDFDSEIRKNGKNEQTKIEISKSQRFNFDWRVFRSFRPIPKNTK